MLGKGTVFPPFPSSVSVRERAIPGNRRECLLLVAQAQLGGLVLVTRDLDIARYEVPVVRARADARRGFLARLTGGRPRVHRKRRGGRSPTSGGRRRVRAPSAGSALRRE